MPDQTPTVIPPAVLLTALTTYEDTIRGESTPRDDARILSDYTPTLRAAMNAALTAAHRETFPDAVIINTTPAPPGEWDTVNVATGLSLTSALVLTLGAAAELMRQLPRTTAQAAIRAAYRADPDSLAALAGSITGSVFTTLRRSNTRRRVYQDDRP